MPIARDLNPPLPIFLAVRTIGWVQGVSWPSSCICLNTIAALLLCLLRAVAARLTETLKIEWVFEEFPISLVGLNVVRM